MGGAVGRCWSSGAGVSSSFWNSQMLTSCATPSSVITKSLAVRPSMIFPLLSRAITVSITRLVPVENLAAPLVGCWAWPACGGVLGGCCCLGAGCWAAATRIRRSNAREIFGIVLEPHSDGGLHAAHAISLGRQTAEL